MMSGWVDATNGNFTIVASLLPPFIHLRLELINVLKAAVSIGETQIRHFIELLVLAHNQFANAR
jgi:hypothetical protein